MADTSIILTSKNGSGKTINKSIPYVNSAARNADLAELGTRLNAFTNNEYVGTNRVDKTNCDTEQGGGGGGDGLLDPNLSVTHVNEYVYNVTRLGTGNLKAFAGADEYIACGSVSCIDLASTIEGGVTFDFSAYAGTYGNKIYVFLESDGTYAADWAFKSEYN